MQVQSINQNKIQYKSGYFLKNNEIQHEGTKKTTLPAFADAKSFVNINFKARIHDCAKEGNWDGIKAELDKGVNVNLQDELDNTALIWAIYKKDSDTVEKLLQHPDIDVNLQDDIGNTALIWAIYKEDSDTIEKLLQHPDIDLNLKNCRRYSALDYCRTNQKIKNMIQEYKRGVDKRQSTIEKKPQKLDIAKLTSYKEIWSENEKQKLEKLIEENNYKEVIQLMETKGKEFNKKYEQLIQSVEIIKEETRTAETEKIRAEEKEKAEQELAQKIAETKEKNKALDSLINNYQQLLAEDVENAKSGFRSLYRINEDVIPENMGIGEQMVCVINSLAHRKNKLQNLNSDFAENITKALQDNNKRISNDGLKFLERIIDASDEQCSEKDLSESIKAVKGKNGVIDLAKAGLFVSLLALGNTTLKNAMQKIGNYRI